MKPDASPNEESRTVQAELAAGDLMWGVGIDARKLLVIRRDRRADWTLPKGKAKPEESPEKAAERIQQNALINSSRIATHHL